MSEPKQTEKRAVDELREHPDQHRLMGDISDDELNALMHSIKQHGLQHPIEILPDGTIVAGHQRFRAIKALGWIDVEVIIRHDLADAGDDAVRVYLIEDNLRRRQMDQLAIARAYRNLKEIESKREYNQLSTGGRRDVRDRVADLMGGQISGRTLDRYDQILDLPRPVQDAVSAKQLTVTCALQVAKLTKAEQHRIADRIKAGENPKTVVQDYVAPRKKPATGQQPRDPIMLYGRLLDVLEESLEVLPRYAEDLAGRLDDSPAVSSILKRSQDLIESLYQAEMAFQNGAFEPFDGDD